METIWSDKSAKSHPTDAADIPAAIAGSKASLPSQMTPPSPPPPPPPALLPVRRSILSPNNFRRLILQFGLARPYAHEITLIRPAHIPAIKRKWALDRPISSRDPSLPSSLFLLRFPLPPPAPLLSLAFLSFSVSRARPGRSSLEKCIGWRTTL